MLPPSSKLVLDLLSTGISSNYWQIVSICEELKHYRPGRIQLTPMTKPLADKWAYFAWQKLKVNIERASHATMKKRSTFNIIACWLLATHPIAECSTSSGQLYQMISDEGGQALCAANVPNQQVMAKSIAQCMVECLQFPGCTGANFVNSQPVRCTATFPTRSTHMLGANTTR